MLKAVLQASIKSTCHLLSNSSNKVITKMSQYVYRNPRIYYRSLPDEDRLFWVDLEMTGLDIDKCHILEIACVITDGNLNIVAEGPNLIIHQPDHILENMNDWCIKHHGKSGLIDASRQSRVSLQEAEMCVLSFVRQHTPVGRCPIAGNTVHEDKRFLIKYMPELVKYLHYRIVDVSTVKELCRRWYPQDYRNAPKKQAAHRALDDILESINELKYYRDIIFKK